MFVRPWNWNRFWPWKFMTILSALECHKLLSCAIVDWRNGWCRVCEFPSTSYKTHICPHLIFKQPCRTWLQSELQPNLARCLSHEPMYLSLPLLFFKYCPCPPLLDRFILQVYFLFPFPNCAPYPDSLISLSQYSSLQPTPGSFNIWFHQSLLTKASKISVHTFLFFFKPISPQTAFHVLILPQQFSSTLYSL